MGDFYAGLGCGVIVGYLFGGLLMYLSMKSEGWKRTDV